MDAFMPNVQDPPKKVAIVRFGPLFLWVGVAGIRKLSPRPKPDHNDCRKAGDRSVANVVEFYIPSTFRKQVKWTPPEQRGKLIEFYTPAKKSA